MAAAIGMITFGGMLIASALKGVSIIDLLAGVAGHPLTPGSGRKFARDTEGGGTNSPVHVTPGLTEGLAMIGNTYPGSPVPGQRPHASTHETAGLSGYPAYDYMAPAGSPVVSPVTGRVTRLSGHDPAHGPTNGPHGPFGLSAYITGAGKTYYLTHLGTRNLRVGQRVKQGQKIGTVGNYAKWGGADHVHQGVRG